MTSTKDCNFQSGDSAFQSEPGFCPECGAILPMPGTNPVVTCRVCSYSVSVTVYHGIETYSEYIYNPLEEEWQTKAQGPKTVDPTIDRQCGSCGHDKMFYKTQQTRSADEGQTVFYMCASCGAKEVENA